MNNVNPMPNIAMVPGPPVGPAMPMMNNGGVAPPPGPRPQQPSENNKHLLNTYIYEYFLRNDMFDCARALLNADPGMKIQDGPNTRRDADGNIIANGDSMDVDNKDGIDSKGAEGLPQPSIPNPSMDNPFLYEWFCLFWDMFNAQKGKSGNPQVSSYMSHTQNQSRMRQNAQQEMLRNMRPDMTPQQQQQQLNMMRMQNGGMNMAMKNPNNMAQRAMANNQNNPQMMHMLQQQQQQQKQGQMQRDPSEMDGNRARPSSPGSAENAPSPSKRMRLENGAPFNPGQVGMMPNGRPAGQGMPGQQVGPDPSALLQQQTVQLLHQFGIDPNALNREQFATLQAQSPAVQQKTIATYAQNLQQQQQQQMPKPGMPNANPSGPPGQGSPMVPQGPDGTSINTFYNAGEMAGPGAIRPAGGPNAGQAAGGSNHALQDYQMQLMLLEQQNKKRLMMARQEQDGSSSGIQMPREGGPGGPGAPGAPPGTAPPFQGTSPQGARPGASPNPADMKRGPHQMNPAGMGSPMAEGSQSRGSPNAMFMGNQMDPSQAPQFNMNGMAGGPQMNGLRPPSSHPGQPPFTGPMNPQQQQQMMAARQGQMAGQPGQQMQWQQGGPGGPNGNQMGPQGQTPQQIQGTPQQRNAMPPPAQPAAAAGVNARNTSSPQVTNTAPPTPSQQNKAAPKKKDAKNAKDKKKSNPSLNSGATPVAEPAADAEATPATPITPVNPQQNLNRPGQNAAPNQAMPNGQAPAPVPQQAAPSMVPQPDPNQNQTFNMDSMADFGSLDFANPLASNDVLNDFDFDSFLHDNEGADGGFDFSNTGAFMDADGIET